MTEICAWKGCDCGQGEAAMGRRAAQKGSAMTLLGYFSCRQCNDVQGAILLESDGLALHVECTCGASIPITFSMVELPANEERETEKDTCIDEVYEKQLDCKPALGKAQRPNQEKAPCHPYRPNSIRK